MSTLDELERLNAEATKAPWTVDDSTSGLGFDLDPVPCGIRKMLEHEADARLIVAARNALPALLRVAQAALELREADRQNTAVRHMKGFEIVQATDGSEAAFLEFLDAPHRRLQAAREAYEAALDALEALTTTTTAP